MRGRPDLKLYLRPSKPSPGDAMRAELHLASKSETPFEAIDVELVGQERYFQSITRVNDVSVVNYQTREFLRASHSFAGGLLTPGDHTRAVRFSIPESAPPSFSSQHTAIWYELSVRVRIPWWPDRHELYTVVVRPPALALAAPAPRVYSTHINKAPADEPVIELSLASDQAQPGGELRGAVAFFNLGSRKIRRVSLTLSTIEHPLAVSVYGPSLVEKVAFLISEKAPRDGASLPFRVAIPEGLTPAFRTGHIEVKHELSIEAEVALGRDLGLKVPITLARLAEGATPEGELPLVGSARKAAIFRGVLSSLRKSGYDLLDEDPDEASVTFRVKELLVQASEEHREGLGPCLAVHVEGPPLGLGLRLCERSWTDLGARLGSIDGRFQERFTVRCREEAQAAALLTAPLREALSRFEEVAVDDDEVAAVWPRAGLEQRELLSFFQGARALAEELAGARRRLPPPASLAALLPAYESFADEHDLALCRGDLSLRRWRVGGVDLSLEHAFEGETATRSHLWASAAPRGDAAPWFEAIVQSTDRQPIFEAGRTGIVVSPSIAGPICADPREAAALAEVFAEAIAALRSGASSSPYR